MLSLIMNANNLFDFGVCSYDNIVDKLIECENKKRIPPHAESVICVVFPTNVDVVFDEPNEVFRLRRVASQMLELTCIALRKAFSEYKFEWFLDDSPWRDWRQRTAAHTSIWLFLFYRQHHYRSDYSRDRGRNQPMYPLQEVYQFMSRRSALGAKRI